MKNAEKDQVVVDYLTKENIPFIIDVEYMKDLCGLELPLVKVLATKRNQSEFYIGFDRYGFVIDGLDRSFEVDQISFEEVKAIINQIIK